MRFVLALILLLGGQQGLPRPENLTGVIATRCEIKLNYIEGETTRWKTHVIVKFSESPAWERLLSMHEDIKSALKDCAHWMEFIRKESRKAAEGR